MKVVITNEVTINKGDFVVFETEEQGAKVYILSEIKETVALFSVADGEIKYSIAKDRGFQELIEHAKGFLEENLTISKVTIAKNSNVTLTIEV